MSQVGILIFDRDAARALAIAASAERLGIDVLVDGSDEADAAVVDARLIADRPALLTDLRRRSPDILIALMVDAGTLDAAGTALGLGRISFLPATPDDADLLLALAPLERAGPPGFAEGDAGYGLRLAALGEEIARIARAIEPPAVLADAPPVPIAPLAFDPAIVRGVLKSRRQRDALFASGTFADPAWDMLLDLTAARGEGKQVAVSSLAIAASVPPTTALRHLKAMVEAGLVVRRADPEDGRRAYIDLSDDAFARMRAWVAGLPK